MAAATNGRGALAEAESSTARGAGTAHEVDLIIVGAGPVGLYGAYYAGFRGLKTALLDSLTEPGGQITAMYPEKLIYDVAGFPAIKGQELVSNLVAQAAPFEPLYLLGQQAAGLSHTDGGKVSITSHTGTVVTGRAVIITGGLGTFTPRPLPNARDFEGRGLQYFVPELDKLAGLDVLIVGGGDSAFDWALSLEPLARTVTLIHRRETFRAHEHTVKQVLDSTARVITSTEIVRLIGNEHLEAAEVVHKPTGEHAVLDVQAVVAALGFTADLGPLKEWGLELNKRQIAVDTTMATNLPRVFAAGDIADYRGKVKLISVGFGEVATAVNNAATIIDPSLGLFPGHSSNQ